MRTDQPKMLIPIGNALETLNRLETMVKDTENEALSDIAKCEPRKLFHLVSWSANYAATASSAIEIYPDDSQIKTHEKNATNILFKNTQRLVNRFEKECRCRKTYFD